MSRLTISLPEGLHQALKETAARRRATMADVIAESLIAYGVKTEASAEDLVRSARRSAALGEPAALELALAETRAARRRKR